MYVTGLANVEKTRTFMILQLYVEYSVIKFFIKLYKYMYVCFGCTIIFNLILNTICLIDCDVY